MNLESNVYERVNEIVDELRFRSFDKVYATVKNELRSWFVKMWKIDGKINLVFILNL